MATPGIRLPLRLAVEPHLQAFFGGGIFVLPSVEEEKVCFVVGERGVLALSLECNVDRNAPTQEEIAKILDCSVEDLPSFCLIRSSHDKHDPFWWARVSGSAKREKIKACRSDLLTSGAIMQINTISAAMVTRGIHRYYSRQVLEPSIRGFLTILEKQFPRADLYLFELLQNAVDDGAMNVVFCTHGTHGSNQSDRSESSGPGISFLHDGKPFSPLDVLGLASVGLSTKGLAADGPKRTIGFMGIGFKAVYKRFKRVTIHDDVWCWKFEEPGSSSSSNNCGDSGTSVPTHKASKNHGWVMLPQWIGLREARSRSLLWDTDKYLDSNSKGTSKSTSTSTSTENSSPRGHTYCHFQLELPRDLAAMRDLSFLPRSVPPLLGRQALKNRFLQGQFGGGNGSQAHNKMEKAESENGKEEKEDGGEREMPRWRLRWGDTAYRVARLASTAVAASTAAATAGGSQQFQSLDRCRSWDRSPTASTSVSMI
jgi:hypothetical protein